MTAIARLIALGDRAPVRAVPLFGDGRLHALVDAADYEWAMAWRWNAGWPPNTPHKFYAKRNVGTARSTLYLHRELMMAREPLHPDLYPTYLVDHINGHPLDDRRSCNLRWATKSENVINSRPWSDVPTIEDIAAGVLRALDDVEDAALAATF